jgi:hypothetical protein
MGQLLGASGNSALAGHPHGMIRRARRIAAAGIVQPVHLPLERINTAERSRIMQRHENRRAPSFLRIGTAEAGKSTGERFDHQRHAEPLVTG